VIPMYTLTQFLKIPDIVQDIKRFLACLRVRFWRCLSLKRGGGLFFYWNSCYSWIYKKNNYHFPFITVKSNTCKNFRWVCVKFT
jgi:hypothetical protein